MPSMVASCCAPQMSTEMGSRGRKRMSVFTCVTVLAAVALWRDSQICRLLSDTQSIDHRSVARIIYVTEIVQQPSATSDQLQQTTPRVMIFLVEFEMLGQIADTVGQYSNLNLRRPGIAVMLPVLLD